jgi:protein-S-isoprenylcysteine O-methyltransferase Ste14
VARWLPLLDITVAFILTFALRAWLHHHRTGEWGVVVFRRGPLRKRFPELLLITAVLPLVGQAIFTAVAGGSSAIVFDMATAAGLFTSAVGVLLICIAQSRLGESWRVGVDWEARPGLKSEGIYRWSRNPIFVGLAMIVLGYVLLLPTPLSLVAFLAVAAAIHLQVLVEERYLATAYGEDFRHYARNVNRYLPVMSWRRRTAR